MWHDFAIAVAGGTLFTGFAGGVAVLYKMRPERDTVVAHNREAAVISAHNSITIAEKARDDALERERYERARAERAEDERDTAVLTRERAVARAEAAEGELESLQEQVRQLQLQLTEVQGALADALLRLRAPDAD